MSADSDVEVNIRTNIARSSHQSQIKPVISLKSSWNKFYRFVRFVRAEYNSWKKKNSEAAWSLREKDTN